MPRSSFSLFRFSNIRYILSFLIEHYLKNTVVLSYAVEKEYRGMGVGSMVFQALTESLEKRSVIKSIATFSRHATGFIRKFGFEVYKKTPDGVFLIRSRNN